MANTQTAVERIEFIIQPELTICNIFYSSSEPGNPFWGGGWKTKTFPASKTCIDILKEDVGDYIIWNDGRNGINEN